MRFELKSGVTVISSIATHFTVSVSHGQDKGFWNSYTTSVKDMDDFQNVQLVILVFFP